MPDRQLLHFDIADRQHALRDLVAPDDFLLARRDTPCPFPDNALAYCADMQAERVLFSLHGSAIAGLFDAPFLYAAQLRDAHRVVSVPFERLAEFETGVTCRPALIFSAGRAGSTLLARLLAACGAPCASEPDMLTQVCRFEREDRMRIGPDMEVALLRACLVALCRALGPTPFVKLRSQCNARPLPLLRAAGGATFVLVRQLGPWAMSRHLAFGEPAGSVAAVLRQAMDAVDKLLGAPAPATVLWFEDLLRNPVAVLRSWLPERHVDPATVARIMAVDSQAGTVLARGRRVKTPSAPGFAAEFEAAWRDARQGAEWMVETLALLDRMEESLGRQAAVLF